jgi:hypothetical protein
MISSKEAAAKVAGRMCFNHNLLAQRLSCPASPKAWGRTAIVVVSRARKIKNHH